MSKKPNQNNGGGVDIDINRVNGAFRFVAAQSTVRPITRLSRPNCASVGDMVSDLAGLCEAGSSPPIAPRHYSMGVCCQSFG